MNKHVHQLLLHNLDAWNSYIEFRNSFERDFVCTEGCIPMCDIPKYAEAKYLKQSVLCEGQLYLSSTEGKHPLHTREIVLATICMTRRRP